MFYFYGNISTSSCQSGSLLNLRKNSAKKLETFTNSNQGKQTELMTFSKLRRKLIMQLPTETIILTLFWYVLSDLIQTIFKSTVTFSPVILIYYRIFVIEVKMIVFHMKFMYNTLHLH